MFFGAPDDRGGRRGDRAARAHVRPGGCCSACCSRRRRAEPVAACGSSPTDGAGGRRAMKCPYCAHLGDKVVDSRESKEGEVIRRRRECLDAASASPATSGSTRSRTWWSRRTARRERFERQKLIAGLLKACEKRPVSVAALEAVADRVEADAAGAAREGDRRPPTSARS